MVKNKDVDEIQLVQLAIQYWTGFIDAVEYIKETAEDVEADETVLDLTSKLLKSSIQNQKDQRDKLQRLKKEIRNASRSKKRVRKM